MNILVTGGAGFIGTNLIKKLLKNGHSITSIDNYSTGLKDNELKHKNIIYLNKDICEVNINDINHWKQFDIVYHLAAIARIQPSFKKPLDYFETNATATMKIAKICSEVNIPLIYAGSSSHHSGVYSNPYTFSKSIGEDILELFANTAVNGAAIHPS